MKNFGIIRDSLLLHVKIYGAININKILLELKIRYTGTKQLFSKFFLKILRHVKTIILTHKTTETDLVVTNFFFHPGDVKRNQIDYILFKNKFNDVYQATIDMCRDRHQCSFLRFILHGFGLTTRHFMQ